MLALRCARFPEEGRCDSPIQVEVVRSALSTALAELVDRPRLSAGLALFLWTIIAG